MSRLKGRGLQIDDPLGPGPARQHQATVQPGAAQSPETHEDERVERGADDGTAPAYPLAKSHDQIAVREPTAPRPARNSRVMQQPSASPAEAAAPGASGPG